MDNPEQWVLQPGSKQVAADTRVRIIDHLGIQRGGWCSRFYLGPRDRSLCLESSNMTMPEQGKYYSVNEAYRDGFPSRYGDYIDRLRSGVLGRKYASRYIGSMVADFHRTLLKGGFSYPPTEDNKEGNSACFTKPTRLPSCRASRRNGNRWRKKDS